MRDFRAALRAVRTLVCRMRLRADAVFAMVCFYVLSIFGEIVAQMRSTYWAGAEGGGSSEAAGQGQARELRFSQKTFTRRAHPIRPGVVSASNGQIGRCTFRYEIFR